MAKSNTTKRPIPAMRWLETPEKHLPKTVCAVFGKEAFLRRQVLSKLREIFAKKADDGEDYSASFDGTVAEWSRVYEELGTFSMFGPPVRLVILDNADKFVWGKSKNTSKSTEETEKAGSEETQNSGGYSEQLIQYLEQPPETGVLVLDLETCASNTRLYKSLLQNGMLIDCQPFEGKKYEASSALADWLTRTAQEKYGFELPKDAAAVMVDQVGTEMGVLNQELAKLALTVEKGRPVTSRMVREYAGKWKTQTTWEMMDFILAGRARQALEALDKLLGAGDDPIMIAASMTFTLRRMALITRKVLTESYEGRRPDTERAILESGVNSFFVSKTLAQLKWLGRKRCQEVLDQLVALDFDLKGDSSVSRRLLLERFILRLAVPKSF
ncbi:MAG: DNA polymerase III subunit delta [Planctomycetia bacterium]|nr:DNA polymerase III subunit delta [Planctomycetia bacterium]